MTKFLRLAVLIALIFSAKDAFAAGANWYVHKGASGSNNGTSWTNAWNEMSQINFSSVACGDTIWLAGGTYTTSLTLNKVCGSGAVLTINRVLSNDSVPVASPGWTSAFDSQVVMSESEILLNNNVSYITVNGRIGTTAGNNFGIAVRCTSTSGCDTVGGPQTGNIDHLTFSYVELFGPPCITGGGSGIGTCVGGNGGASAGLNVAPSTNTVKSLLFDHGWIHRFSETIRASNWSNCTIQYSDIDTMRQANNGGDHEDIIFSYDQTNFTFRYNTVWGSPNDGVFFYGNEVNTQIYGNVFYHSGGAILTFYQGFTHNVYIYNNVFENDNQFGDYQPGYLYFISGSTMTGAFENNVIENVNLSGSTGNMVVDYNAFNTTVGKQDSGAHSFTYTAGTLGLSVLFISESPSNPLAANFRLTSKGATTLQNGLSLPAPFNMDMDGNNRGGNANWYIGAFAFGSSSAPQPPTGLSITVQ
jgi:hypothetical protein